MLTGAVDGVERLKGVREHRGAPRHRPVLAGALPVDGVTPRERKQTYRGVMAWRNI